MLTRLVKEVVIVQILPETRDLLVVAQELARLRGAAECAPWDVAAASMVLSHRAGRPVGFERQRESPEMLPMAEPIERILREESLPSATEVVKAALSAEPELHRYFEGM